MGNIGIENITFHKNETTVQDGTEYNVAMHSATTIYVEISGTATNSEIIFEGKTFDTWQPRFGVNTSTAEIASNGLVTTKDNSWLIDVTGCTNFRARINSITGGDLTIIGRSVR